MDKKLNITDLKEVADGVWEVDNETGSYVLEAGAVVNFNAGPPGSESNVQFKSYNQTKIAEWGPKNNLPAEREALVMPNNIMPELLLAKRNLLIGQEAVLYRQRFEDGEIKKEYVPMSNAVMDFLEENEFGKSIRFQAKDIILNAQNTIEFVDNSNGIASMKYITATTIRAEKQRAGQILNWFLCDDWTKTNKNPITTVQNMNKRISQDKYIGRWADDFLGGPYYFMPSWYGSKSWIKLANIIPLFHLSNLKNGYTIRYHIEFPRGYFLKLKPGQLLASMTDEDRTKALDDAKARKLKFLKDFNDTLKGTNNAGRAVHSTYSIDKMKGVALPGIKINPIQTDLKDEALLKLFDKSNEAVISAAGILPSLSGISTSGKLSSGSDIRNALAFYLSSKTPEQRRIMYAPWVYALRRNGLIDRDVRMGSLDELIVTTDKNKSGKEQK